VHFAQELDEPFIAGSIDVASRNGLADGATFVLNVSAVIELALGQ
jgi:hypothetical protein